MAGGHPAPVAPPPVLAAPTEGRELLAPHARLRERVHGDDRGRGRQQRRADLQAADHPQRRVDADDHHRDPRRAPRRHRVPLRRVRHRRDRCRAATATRASCRSSTGAVLGRGVFYYVTMGSVVAVLALSANTSFAGLPPPLPRPRARPVPARYVRDPRPATRLLVRRHRPGAPLRRCSSSCSAASPIG